MVINNMNLVFKAMTKRNVSQIDTLYLHHADGFGSVLDIHNYHKYSKGWAGIGYNFYIRKDGTVWKGRPIDVVPSGVLGHNGNSIHICCEGKINQEKLTGYQVERLKELIPYCKEIVPSLKYCKGHKEDGSTDCPGVYYPLDEMKSVFTGRGDTVPVININLEVDKMVIKQGEKSERVKLLQVILNYLVKYNLVTDGSFGGKTLQAVEFYQNLKGLKADGVVGKVTEETIIKDMNRIFSI